MLTLTSPVSLIKYTTPVSITEYDPMDCWRSLSVLLVFHRQRHCQGPTVGDLDFLNKKQLFHQKIRLKTQRKRHQDTPVIMVPRVIQNIGTQSA